MLDTWQMKSNVRLTVRRSGLVVARYFAHNVITYLALAQVRDTLRGEGDPQYRFIGVGAGGAVPSAEDTDMEDERFRVDILLSQPIGVNGLLTTAYISPEQANDFSINELGWWGGAATLAVGTGSLFARVLFNLDKTNLESVQIDRVDTFAEAT